MAALAVFLVFCMARSIAGRAGRAKPEVAPARPLPLNYPGEGNDGGTTRSCLSTPDSRPLAGFRAAVWTERRLRRLLVHVVAAERPGIPDDREFREEESIP